MAVPNSVSVALGHTIVSLQQGASPLVVCVFNSHALYGMTRPGIELTTYRMQGEHSTHLAIAPVHSALLSPVKYSPCIDRANNGNVFLQLLPNCEQITDLHPVTQSIESLIARLKNTKNNGQFMSVCSVLKWG
ncbi:hypothetical protein Bbelb_169460 [Branchiostoma belcheri]|nr:hypothetical protein Bbelb_169460 [Branchiostoma belcheri]